MISIPNYSVQFVKKELAALKEETLTAELPPTAVLGRTLVSLISSGTERGAYLNYTGTNQYPMPTGYAAVLEVVRTGSQVRGLKAGDRLFAQTSHTLYSIVEQKDTIEVPPEMLPEEAVLCRFPAISMTSLLHTRIKPVEPALVTGLGVVGLMCAQVLHHCGYEVYASDPNAGRREIAKQCGIPHVLDGDAPLGKIGLAMECSGSEQATLSACSALRKGGELFLVGVPWVRNSDIYAHELLSRIFNGYLAVSSGWEWSVPLRPTEFAPGSNFGNYRKSMEWIREGGIRVAGIYETVSPAECDTVYRNIAKGTLRKTCILFDWRMLEGDGPPATD